MVKEFICTKCPKGCEIKASGGDGKPFAISGNTCKAGLAYAKSETEDPRRMLTTTVRIAGAHELLLPVKSKSPIPKALMLACMENIREHMASAPVNIGDIVIKDILNTGIDIVAAKEIPHV